MTDTATAVETGHGHDDGHAHASDRHYVNIAIALAVITGVEVAWSYIDMPTWLEIGGLVFMMAIKFFLVASQFMHLKFDDKLLSRLFYTGLFLAVGVYMIALFTFRIFAG
jgi:cytochrome c oxidase subunit IV